MKMMPARTETTLKAIYMNNKAIYASYNQQNKIFENDSFNDRLQLWRNKMKPFSISETYRNEQDERVININPLPRNYCNFDCVFCPLGRTKVKTDEPHAFVETEAFMNKLEKVLRDEKIDRVFINPNGDLFAQSRIREIIKLIKKYEVKVSIISNGYLFNRSDYKAVLNTCDEVTGELAVTKEEDFQKLQRPLKGYTLEDLVCNMAAFNEQYSGEFILDITILKNYSESMEDIDRFREFIKMINPDEIYVHTPQKGQLKTAFGIDEARLQEITEQLKLAINKS